MYLDKVTYQSAFCASYSPDLKSQRITTGVIRLIAQVEKEILTPMRYHNLPISFPGVNVAKY